MSQEIIDYIRKSRAQGISDTLIIHNLQSLGVPENDIVHSLQQLQSPDQQQSATETSTTPQTAVPQSNTDFSKKIAKPSLSLPKIPIRPRTIIIPLVIILLLVGIYFLKDPLFQKLAENKQQQTAEQQPSASPSPTPADPLSQKYPGYQLRKLGQAIALKPNVAFTVTAASIPDATESATIPNWKKSDKTQLIRIEYVVRNENGTEQQILEDNPSPIPFTLVNKQAEQLNTTETKIADGVTELKYLEPKQVFSNSLFYEIPRDSQNSDIYLVVAGPRFTPQLSLIKIF